MECANNNNHHHHHHRHHHHEKPRCCWGSRSYCVRRIKHYLDNKTLPCSQQRKQNNHIIKKALFVAIRLIIQIYTRHFKFPKVVQAHTLSEVGNLGTSFVAGLFRDNPSNFLFKSVYIWQTRSKIYRVVQKSDTPYRSDISKFLGLGVCGDNIDVGSTPILYLDLYTEWSELHRPTRGLIYRKNSIELRKPRTKISGVGNPTKTNKKMKCVLWQRNRTMPL